MDCSPPGSSIHADSPGKNTGVGCHALLQGISSTQGWNPGLPHGRQISYKLSYPGSPDLCIFYHKRKRKKEREGGRADGWMNGWLDL